MLPSLFTSDENQRPWSVPRAALYGAGIGLAAALIKIFGPFHAADWALPVVLENRCCGFRLWAALRRRCTAAQSAGATAPGHATLKAVIRQIKQRRYSPGRMGPTRGIWPFENAVSACGCTPQDKVSSWDLGCDRPDNALN